MSIATWSIESITNHIAATTKLDLNLHELSDLINRVRTRHKELRTFAQNSNDLEQVTLKEFSEWVVSHDTMAIQGILDRVHLLVIGSDDFRSLGNVGTFELLANSIEVSHSAAFSPLSTQPNEKVQQVIHFTHRESSGECENRRRGKWVAQTHVLIFA